MIKFIIILIFLFFIFNLINIYIIQFIIQNLLFLIVFIFLINFPINNLNLWRQIYYNLGVDFYSFGLVILSLWILRLIIIISLKNFIYFNNYYYIIIINILLIFLIVCFFSINIILFYLFFESRLIPVFLLIIGWGYQIDRIQAGFYIILYTLLGSLPLFYFILLINKLNYTLIFNLRYLLIINNIYIYIIIIIAFLIKIPIYLIHLWLPKAHVEAPLVGSIILAGVILKLGSYGLLRFIIIMINLCLKFNKFIIIIRLIGGIYSRLICLCQLDIKILVAYSSVVHIRLLMSGIITIFNFGYLGGILIIIAHGLCSSGLFCLVNINYERLNSRSLLINKGINNFFPSLRLIWFLLCSSNLSFPPSLNLFREIILVRSLILWNKEIILILILILFFRASYSLYLYSFSQHGYFNNLIYYMKGIVVNEYILLLLHWIPLNIIFLFIYIYL